MDADQNRQANVAFANQQLDAEIAYRNTRKDAQENTGRGVVVAAGVVLTLLIGGVATGKDVDTGTDAFRIAFFGTILLASLAGLCALICQWPRKFERMGEEALDHINTDEFLDQDPHEAGGRLLATKVDIAKTADDQHDKKNDWLIRSLWLLVGTFVALAALAAVLVFQDKKTTPSARPTVTIIRQADGGATGATGKHGSARKQSRPGANP